MTIIETNAAGDTIESRSDYAAWATITTDDLGGCVKQHWAHDNSTGNVRRLVATSHHQADGQLHRLTSQGPAVTVHAPSGNVGYEYWEHGKLGWRESDIRTPTSYGWTIEHINHQGAGRVESTEFFDHNGDTLIGPPVASDEYAELF